MSDERILHLIVYRRWYILIAAGKKNVEYRRHTPFWRQRLENREYTHVIFRNGYARNSPRCKRQFLGVTKSVYEGEKCYAIKLGTIEYADNAEI